MERPLLRVYQRRKTEELQQLSRNHLPILVGLLTGHWVKEKLEL